MRFHQNLQRTVLIGAGIFTLAAISGRASTAARLHLGAGINPQMDSANIYSDTANAREDIRQAILKAASEHKHVLLVFGGNWCEDCHLLELYFHDPGNASLLAANYVLVNVSVGEYDRNLDLARMYGIHLNKGVPALVVLNGAGHVLYAQRNGEFENMRVLNSAAVTTFLLKWKPRGRAHRRK
jgi:thiol:disulfide interchange protein